MLIATQLGDLESGLVRSSTVRELKPRIPDITVIPGCLSVAIIAVKQQTTKPMNIRLGLVTCLCALWFPICVLAILWPCSHHAGPTGCFRGLRTWQLQNPKGPKLEGRMTFPILVTCLQKRVGKVIIHRYPQGFGGLSRNTGLTWEWVQP